MKLNNNSNPQNPKVSPQAPQSNKKSNKNSPQSNKKSNKNSPQSNSPGTKKNCNYLDMKCLLNIDKPIKEYTKLLGAQFGHLFNLPEDTILNESYLTKCKDTKMVYNRNNANSKNTYNKKKKGYKLSHADKILFSPKPKKPGCYITQANLKDVQTENSPTKQSKSKKKDKKEKKKKKEKEKEKKKKKKFKLF